MARLESSYLTAEISSESSGLPGTMTGSPESPPAAHPERKSKVNPLSIDLARLNGTYSIVRPKSAVCLLQKIEYRTTHERWWTVRVSKELVARGLVSCVKFATAKQISQRLR